MSLLILKILIRLNISIFYFKLSLSVHVKLYFSFYNVSVILCSFVLNIERLRASGSGGDRKDTASPFSHSPHGNPAFTPQKVGKASASVSKKVWSIIESFFLLLRIQILV